MWEVKPREIQSNFHDRSVQYIAVSSILIFLSHDIDVAILSVCLSICLFFVMFRYSMETA